MSVRLGVLDGMRGLAILLVVWYHLSLVSGYSLPLAGALNVFARNGFLGVDLFFFVSGFCICYPYARARSEGTPEPSLDQFVRRRALKIFPSYLLAVVAFALIYHTKFEGIFQETIHVLAHLAFVHVWFPDTFGSLSGPLWTLGVEVQFYVLFAALAGQFVRRPLVVYGTFVAVAIAYRGLLARVGLDTDFNWLNQLPAVLDIFGAGMVAALAFVHLARGEPAKRQKLAGLCALSALALALVGFVGVDGAARAGGDDAVHRWLNAWRVLFGPVLFIAMLGLSLGHARLRRFASLPVLTWLSLVSYNAYLWNLEVTVLLHDRGFPPWAIFWLGAVATLALATALTFAFERPIQSSGRAWSLPAWRGFSWLSAGPHFRASRARRTNGATFKGRRWKP